MPCITLRTSLNNNTLSVKLTEHHDSCLNMNMITTFSDISMFYVDAQRYACSYMHIYNRILKRWRLTNTDAMYSFSSEPVHEILSCSFSLQNRKTTEWLIS